MCRLCLITTTELPDAGIDIQHFKAQLMHECMLRSSHEDGGQKDGWGVTDTQNIWRSTDWYFEDTPVWMRGINAQGIMFSHLRKASAGTGRTERDQHPYIFTVGGDQLIAVHNGYFDGTAHTGWSATTPNTDSYRALAELATMLEKKHAARITREIMNEWLSSFTDASHYALMIHWRDEVYLTRGNTRTLHGLPLGNGYLVHTSLPVVKQMRDYVQKLYDLETPEIVAVPINSLIRMRPGSLEVNTYALDIKHLRVQQAVWANSYPKANVTVPDRGSVNTSVVGDDYVIAPSVTTPRPARTSTALVSSVTPPITAPAAFTLKERRTHWSLTSGKLSPLRKSLSTYWAASVLGYVNEKTAEPLTHTFLVYASKAEFDLVEAVLLPRTSEGTFLKPFSPIAMNMINWWNHLVNPGFDQEVHQELFGTRFFWLDTYYTRMKDDVGKYNNSGIVMRAWTSYMLRLFANVLDRQQINKWLDTKVLAAMLDERPTAIALLEG